MQLHELLRECFRFFPRLGFDDGVAADDFLRFGERAIGTVSLPPLDDAIAVPVRFSPAVSLRMPLLKLSSTNLPIAS